MLVAIPGKDMVDIALKVDVVFANDEILTLSGQVVADVVFLAERVKPLLRSRLRVHGGSLGVVVVEAYELYLRVHGLAQDDGKQPVSVVATPHTGLHFYEGNDHSGELQRRADYAGMRGQPEADAEPGL